MCFCSPRQSCANGARWICYRQLEATRARTTKRSTHRIAPTSSLMLTPAMALYLVQDTMLARPSMHEVNSHWAIGITSTARREAKSADVSSRSIARTYRSADGPTRQSAAGCGSARRATWHSGCGRRASSVHTSEKVSSGFSTHTLP